MLRLGVRNGVRREPVLDSYHPVCFDEIGTEEGYEPCFDGLEACVKVDASNVCL